MYSSADVSLRLEKVDWNFARSQSSDTTVHSLHWFPGNFIPQIPAYLIQALTNEGDLVLDPFGGSGTTAVEALRLGRRAALGDSNVAALHVAKGKVAGLRGRQLARPLSDLADRLILDGSLRTKVLGLQGEGSAQELGRWLHENTWGQLRYLWKLIEAIESTHLRAFVEMIFTDTLFACCSSGAARTASGLRRRHHWGWIADNVAPKVPFEHNAIGLFRDRIYSAVRIIAEEEPIAIETAKIERHDARTLWMQPESVDLVVTSPPYIGMIDYALANRVTYLWMGWDMGADRRSEMGSRRNRTRPSLLTEYASDIRQSAAAISEALRPGGSCAIVIGASRKYVGADAEVVRLFGEYLDLAWGPTPREPTRRRVSDSKGSRFMELVCLFQKVRK